MAVSSVYVLFETSKRRGRREKRESNSNRRNTKIIRMSETPDWQLCKRIHSRERQIEMNTEARRETDEKTHTNAFILVSNYYYLECHCPRRQEQVRQRSLDYSSRYSVRRWSQ